MQLLCGIALVVTMSLIAGWKFGGVIERYFNDEPEYDDYATF